MSFADRAHFFLAPVEVAGLTGRTIRTVQRWVMSRRFAVVRSSDGIWILRRDLEQVLGGRILVSASGLELVGGVPRRISLMMGQAAVVDFT